MELAYYLVFAQRATMTLAEVSGVRGTRWDIEVAFETAKGDCGPGDYEVRTWATWHRHVTLVLAHAFLVVMRAQSLQKGDPLWTMDGIPLTVPEVRRLVWPLCWARPPTQALVLAWSRWRRRHQFRAQRCHDRRRAMTASCSAAAVPNVGSVVRHAGNLWDAPPLN